MMFLFLTPFNSASIEHIHFTLYFISVSIPSSKGPDLQLALKLYLIQKKSTSHVFCLA